MKKIIASIVALLTLAFALTACGSKEPETLDGKWHGEDAVEAIFDATVANGEISIDMTLGGMTALYWKGSLPETMKEGEVHASSGDMKALDASIYGAMDDGKEFTYTDGKLEFTFQILGTTQVIQLEKQ